MPSNYSEHERIIARFLSSVPVIKGIVKSTYRYICRIRHRRKYTSRSIFLIKAIGCNLSHDNFFGYYDKSPANIDSDHIIYHSSKYPTYKKPGPDIPVEIILQELSTGKVLLNITSYAYNWQQGCRTQWLDNDLFIFNDFDVMRKKYISRVWSLSSLAEVKIFDFPVQDSYQADYFLSLNYRRFVTIRPDYGYKNLPRMKKEELENKDTDGIWKVDYKSGKSKLLINFLSICSDCHKDIRDSAINKVNHIMISPTGGHFIFLHRYYTRKGRFDRLMLADAITGELRLLADYGMVSHCFWLDGKTILAYLRGPNKKDAYWLINTATGNFIPAANGKLGQYGDGHPHVHGDWFVTDTYPDKAGMQHLLLANWKTNEVKELGEFFHGLKYSGETRCDLHPRFSPDGNSVFFDSVLSGKRQLYKMEVLL
ncbi:MAG: hypothetical protein LBP76_02440 [Treponema sp.]|jgi:hypothetical protein|nr:hypothetical protein [Treponema sp.]